MKKQIGVVGVDSGMLMILDPGNLEGRFEPWDKGLCDKLMKLTDNINQAGQLNYKAKNPGLGVVFASGRGDGLYPVFAHYSDGVITKIEIDFI